MHKNLFELFVLTGGGDAQKLPSCWDKRSQAIFHAQARTLMPFDPTSHLVEFPLLNIFSLSVCFDQIMDIFMNNEQLRVD